MGGSLGKLSVLQGYAVIPAAPMYQKGCMVTPGNCFYSSCSVMWRTESQRDGAPQGMKARIVLADDHEIVRKGIRSLLDGQFAWKVCGEAENGREAVDRVLELKPDLVVLDLSMPVLNGLEAAREIRHVAPKTKIIIFSMHDSPRIAEEAKRAGADAYLVKTAHFTELQKTIAALLNGKHTQTDE